MTSDSDGPRIVVTGGAGLIGRPTIAALQAEGARPVCFDRVAGPAGVESVVADLLDREAVIDAIEDADAVVHLGGVPGMDITDDVTTYAVNTVGTYAVFSAAAAAGVRKVVYASSINANGLPLGKAHPPKRLPYDEDEPAAIRDCYSLSKEANEAAARMVHRRWGLQLTGLRFPLVRDIEADGGRTFASHIRTALREDPKRQAYEGWSYLHTADAARAVVLALRRTTPPAPGILVAADRTYLSTPTAEAARIVVPEVPVLGLEDTEVGLDLTRARTLLGFHAEHYLEDVAESHLAPVVPS